MAETEERLKKYAIQFNEIWNDMHNPKYSGVEFGYEHPDFSVTVVKPAYEDGQDNSPRQYRVSLRRQRHVKLLTRRNRISLLART